MPLNHAANSDALHRQGSTDNSLAADSGLAELHAPSAANSTVHLMRYAAPGSILQLTEGERWLLCSATSDGYQVLVYRDNQLLECRRSSSELNSLHSQGRLVQMELPGQTTLITGRTVEHQGPLCWRFLGRGALLQHGPRQTEEILNVKECPFKDPSHKIVDSLVRNGEAVELIQGKLRSDKELARLHPSQVRIKIPCSLWEGNRSFAEQPNSPTLRRGIFSPFQLSLGGYLEQIESRAAGEVAQFTERLTRTILKERRGHAPNGEWPAGSAFENLLGLLRALHKSRITLERTMDVMGSALFLGAAPPTDSKRVADLARAVDDARTKLPSSSLGQLASHGRQVLLRALQSLTAPADAVLQKAEQSNDSKMLICAFTAKLEALHAALQTYRRQHLSKTGLASCYTIVHTPEGLSDGVLKAVFGIAESARRNQADHSVAFSGIIIDNFYRPDYVREMVVQGARLITHHEPGKSGERDKLSGFLLFFEPGKVPISALGIRQDQRAEGRTACLDVICLRRNASITAHQRLYDRAVIELQRTDADWLYAEIMSRNQASFRGSIANAGIPDCGVRIVRESPDGMDVRWIGVRLAIHPELRQVLLPIARGADPALARAFAAQARQEEYGVPPMTAAEEEDLKAFAEDALLRTGASAYTRISFGAGNMTPRELKALRQIIEEGCRGLDGVLAWGATRMLVKVDGERLTAASRWGIHQSIQAICDDGAASLVPVGINIYDRAPADAPVVEVRASRGIEQYRVINPAEDGAAPYLTVEDPDVPRRLRFTADPKNSFPFYDVEAERCAALGEKLAQIAADNGPADTPFYRIAIFGSGGGTVAREIRRRVLDGTQVILIDCRNEELRRSKTSGARPPSATEMYADDDDWRREHHNAHVVTSGRELRQLLIGFGAIRPDAIIPGLSEKEAAIR